MEGWLALAAFAAGAAAAFAVLRARTRGARAPTTPGDARLDTRLDALHAELGRVTSLVRSLEHDRERQYGALAEQIAGTSARTAELHETTRALAETLASHRARGQWGERMADDVLRAAGLVEGISYRRQTAVEGGGVPDFAILLPEDREVRLDVKFPLDNYVRAVRASTTDETERARAAFLRDARRHVRELAGRGYLDGDTTIDCLLLFVPNEQVFAYLCEHDPGLVDEALARRVVLCSPFTLFAVLAVIRQAVETFRLARTGDEILAALAGFTGQWEAFTEQLDKLGTHLERTQGAFEALTTTRRRQLDRQLERIEELRSGAGAGASAGAAPDARGPPAR